MGGLTLFLKQLIFSLFLCSVFSATECAEAKLDTFDLEGKQFYVINEVGISSEYGYGIQESKAICNNANKCSYGGTCFNNTCICLPGTSGPLCKTINSCSEMNCNEDKNALCDFDRKNFKAFCKCPWGQEFDYDENKCKDCLCDTCEEGEMCIAQVKCEIIRGEKACTCRMPNYQFNSKKKICELCYCGSDSNGCDFDEDGHKQCHCKEKYAQKLNFCERCECYTGKGCKFVGFDKVCICKPDYVEDDGTCYSCTCGENGKCVWGGWYHEQQGCICNPGFMEVDKVCREISECYCGENSNCTIKNEEKICSCEEGFTNVSGLCVDINECDNPKACPNNTRCFNLIGNYTCLCADGFQPSREKEGECEDINECLNSNSCADSNSRCFNTFGSFRCVCLSGYATRDGIAANHICENKSSWKLGFGFLIGTFLAIIIGLIIMIYRKS